MGLNDKNLASGVLASSVASSATTLSVNCGTGSSSTLAGVWPSVPFYITVMPASPSAGVANSLDSEIMQVTAITSDGSTVTMTVSRGKKGTTAKSFGEGSIVTNSIYTSAGRYTATTSSADGASTMVYTITSDELPNEPSDGDILLVQFPKQADNNATLKVNNGSFDLIYCQSIDGAQLSATRQENPTSTVEPLLLTDRWYILIYHYGENYGSGGWILQNTFLPVSGSSGTPGDKVVMRNASDPVTISTTRVSIVSTTVDSDGDYLAIGSVSAGTGSQDALYSYAFIDNGTDNTTYATNISTINSGRICMTVMGKITGLHQGDTVRLSAQVQGSSYSTQSRDQSLALIKLKGPSAIDELITSKRVNLYHSDSTSSAGATQEILYDDLNDDLDKYQFIIVDAFSPQSGYTSGRSDNIFSAEGLKGSGKKMLIVNNGYSNSNNGTQFECIQMRAGTNGLVFEKCFISRGGDSQSSTPTVYNQQPIRVADIWGVGGINNKVEVLESETIWAGSSTSSTLTLDNPVSLYDFIEVFYTYGDGGDMQSTKVPVGTTTKPTLMVSGFTNSQTLNYEVVQCSITGRTLSRGAGMRWNNVWGSSGITATVTGSDIYITEVVGIKVGTSTDKYAVTEMATGVAWTDGKPIYKKTVIFGTSAATEAINVSTGITNGDTLVRLDCCVKSETSGVWYPIPFGEPGSWEVFVRSVSAGLGTFVIKASSGYGAVLNGIYGHATLYYTKA